MKIYNTELYEMIEEIEDNRPEYLEVIWFLLKKMEYMQKKRNKATEYIKRIETAMVDVPKRGYNPMYFDE
jgi:hypothetical protein